MKPVWRALTPVVIIAAFWAIFYTAAEVSIMLGWPFWALPAALLIVGVAVAIYLAKQFLDEATGERDKQDW